MRAWHEANPGKEAEYQARYRASNKYRDSLNSRVFRNRRWSWEFRQAAGCTDCGITDPRILEFDHVDGTKANEVSAMVRDGQALETIIAEAEKCEVRCRNCHFLITLERQNAYSHRWFTEGVPWESEPGSQKK